MPHSRRHDQSVEAFSASKELLKKAKARAAKLGMTKSGYFRYCLALELGYPDDQARQMADHNSVQALRTSVEQGEPANYRGQTHPFVMNDQAAQPVDETIIHDKRKKKPVSSGLPAGEESKLNEQVAAELARVRAGGAKFAPRPATGGRPGRRARRNAPSPPGSKVPPPASGAKGQT